MKLRIALLLALLGGLFLASGGVWAQDWSELSARQQRQLADFQSIWSQLPDNRRARLIGSADQIGRMTPANRKKLVDSMTQAAEIEEGFNPSPR